MEPYEWLKNNVSKWQWIQATGAWINSEGKQYYPGGYFVFKSTRYCGHTFEEALQLVMKEYPNG